MEGNVDNQLMMELAEQPPALLAYLAGIALSLVYWRRYPGPCLLTFLAAPLSFVLSVTLSCLRLYAMYARAARGWDRVTVESIISITVVAGGILRAVAFGLLLAAVFVGRRAAPQAWPNPVPQPSGPGQRFAGDEGITSTPGE
jgi:hypothetical protein